MLSTLSAMLVAFTLTTSAHADEEYVESGCYTFDQEPAYSTIDCSSNRAIIDPMTGARHDFVCNPAMGDIDGAYAPDLEFFFDVGTSCFDFTNAPFPTEINVTIRDQAGVAGGTATIVEAYNAFGMLIGSFTVPIAYGETTWNFADMAGVESVCVTRNSVGGWQEATLDDICLGTYGDK